MSIYESPVKHTFNISDWNFNSCVPIQNVYKEYVDLTWIQIIFGSIYGTILFLGFVANSATLYCLLSKSYQLGLNVKFLVSLNLSDLFIGVTSLPITAIQSFSRKWLWGASLCRYVPLFQVHNNRFLKTQPFIDASNRRTDQHHANATTERFLKSNFETNF